MVLSEITPLILTYNEQENIGRTLELLQWARRIVVVDSYSSDATLDIIKEFSNVEILQRAFDDFAQQCNFGLRQVQTPWVLSLDADYLCPKQAIEEMAALAPEADAYCSKFRYAIYGRVLGGTLYPPRPCLFRTKSYRYIQDGHAHRLDTGDDRVGILATPLVHDDRKPLSRWLQSQRRYAELEAAKLTQLPKGEGWKSRLRRMIWVAPFLNLAYCLFYQRLVLNGWPGVYYSFQRMYAELLLSLELLDRRLSSVPTSDRTEQSRPEVQQESSRL
jgi:glycosyltransferase involved in cell wall biosynthesis